MNVKHVSFFVVVILILFMECEVNGKEDEDDSPIYVEYVVEIIRSFEKQIEKEFNLKCKGSGGEMPFDVEEISVSFVAYQNATVEQARELEINLTERFAKTINAHEKIKPFLRERPFPSGRARVSISFEKPKKNSSLPNENDVTYVFQVRNRIFYQAENPNNRYVFKDIKDEPYEEALKIVQGNAIKIKDSIRK
jgi:hypothetical protein